MTSRQTPPGRTSISEIVVLKPFGPHHCATCFGSVHTANTSSRGASKTRLKTSSRSAVFASALVFAFPAAMFLLLFFKFLKIVVQAIEALVKKPVVVRHPVGDTLERSSLEPARPPLCFSRACNQSGALQHFQVLGHGGKTDGKRRGQLGDRDLSGLETGENGAPCGVGESGERGAESVGRHCI